MIYDAVYIAVTAPVVVLHRHLRSLVGESDRGVANEAAVAENAVEVLLEVVVEVATAGGDEHSDRLSQLLFN